MHVELTEDQWQKVFDALQMSSAFAVYGEGREEHQAAIREIVDVLNAEWVKENVPF